MAKRVKTADSPTKELAFKSTEEIKVESQIVDQVIGQENGVEIIRKAAAQRRHVLLIGEPGTGKSMLGLALAQLLPKETLRDIISFPNPNDENMPLIRTMPAGQGRNLVNKARIESVSMFKSQNIFLFIIILAMNLLPWWMWRKGTISDIIYAASLLSGIIIIGFYFIMINLSRKMVNTKVSVPKVIVDNFNKKTAPFFDATGSHAGALLGDVLHDPFQSGGLGTPAHERVVAGMIHKANMGVLFIDEIATLQPSTQQELLTSLQEGMYAITGQSERSAGAMVRTEPVPCKFILVAAGNLETIKNMHPALRSRIRGYGYEVFMNETMEDNVENRNRIARFVAQEVTKDKKIPHFSKEAVQEIVQIARRMANRKNHLTVRLRELGGIVRAAGDIATEEKAKLVEVSHIKKAKYVARNLEQQIADKHIERKKEYAVIVTEGERIGRVNGLAVIGGGSSLSGIILPIEAEVTPGGKEAHVVATGQLGKIAKEAVKNVSAIIMSYFGTDIKENLDIYVQFLQTHEGVEGDSASIAIATAILSALKKLPIKQDFAMTGSLSVRGEVLPIGGVSAKIEAAISAGIKNVIVPRSNMEDIVVEKDQIGKINIIPVDTIIDVWKKALDWKGHQDMLKLIEQADHK